MKLNSILVFSENPKQLAEFYKKVFNKEPSFTVGDYTEFNTGGAYFEVGPHKKVHGKNNGIQ